MVLRFKSLVGPCSKEEDSGGMLPDPTPQIGISKYFVLHASHLFGPLLFIWTSATSKGLSANPRQAADHYTQGTS